MGFEANAKLPRAATIFASIITNYFVEQKVNGFNRILRVFLIARDKRRIGCLLYTRRRLKSKTTRSIVWKKGCFFRVSADLGVEKREERERRSECATQRLVDDECTRIQSLTMIRRTRCVLVMRRKHGHLHFLKSSQLLALSGKIKHSHSDKAFAICPVQTLWTPAPRFSCFYPFYQVADQTFFSNWMFIYANDSTLRSKYPVVEFTRKQTYFYIPSLVGLISQQIHQVAPKVSFVL